MKSDLLMKTIDKTAIVWCDSSNSFRKILCENKSHEISWIFFAKELIESLKFGLEGFIEEEDW